MTGPELIALADEARRRGDRNALAAEFEREGLDPFFDRVAAALLEAATYVREQSDA